MAWPISALQLRDELKWPPHTGDGPDPLTVFALAACKRIEREIGPRSGQTLTARAAGPCNVVRFDWPVDVVTSVTVDGTPLALDRLTLDPPAGLLYGRFAGRGVVATATAPSIVDEQIELAAQYLAATWVKQSKVGPPGPRTRASETDGDVAQGFAMPRRVSEMIRPDVIPGGFA
jgi:hypothetical protein